MNNQDNPATRTVTVSQLILMLQQCKAELGDKLVLLSSDPEGNDLGTLNTSGAIGYDADTLPDYIQLFPNTQLQTEEWVGTK